MIIAFFSVAAGVEGANPFAPADTTGRDVVDAIAAAHDASPAQVRLAWTLHQGDHVLAIPGTGDLDHLAENVAAGALRLTEADLAALDAIYVAGPRWGSRGFRDPSGGCQTSDAGAS